MIGVAVLGSTGSIGKNTLDVLARYKDRYELVSLTANTDVAGLYQQTMIFQPQVVAMADLDCARELAGRLAEDAPNIRVLSGTAGLEQAASHPDADQVMAAIVGAAGLLPTLAAVRAGKRILLANKEALVVAGALFMQEVRAHQVQVLPIDSEHNAVFQCLPDNFADGLVQKGVKRILLTASGGPFRTTPRDDLVHVTPEQACAHPNWDMGRKISVDSATMMNKGLEVIEAHWLFNASCEQIQVVVHPQSVVHSMVEYVDGSVLAQLGNPDMRTPIAHALAWPERIDSGVDSLDLFATARLDFEAPDPARFPCLGLAYEAIQAGGSMPAVLNAANEVAVSAFLDRRLAFLQIPLLIEQVMQAMPLQQPEDLQSLMAIDAEARAQAEQSLRQLVS